MEELAPMLDRERYHDEEWALASAGLCSWEVEVGMVMGRVVRCEGASSPESFYRFCDEHDRQARETPGYGR